MYFHDKSTQQVSVHLQCEHCTHFAFNFFSFVQLKQNPHQQYLQSDRLTVLHTQTHTAPLSPCGCCNIPRAAICLPLVWRIKRQDVDWGGSGLWLNAPSMGLFSLQPNKCVTPIITRLILSFCYCSSTSISFCERSLLIIPLWQRGHVPPQSSMTKNVKLVVSTYILSRWYHT